VRHWPHNPSFFALFLLNKEISWGPHLLHLFFTL